MKIDLIIFDCDGVIVDSEIIAHNVGAQELTSLGFSLTVEQSIKLFSGVADKNVSSILQKEYKKTISDNELNSIIKKKDETIRKDLQATENISHVMDYLHKKCTNRCIASNASHDYLTMVLSKTKMDFYFDVDKIFNINMVKNGKPMPDIFLHAADQLKVDPSNCMVVEDSIVGVEAAKAANMPVIGFLGGSHAKNQWYHDKISKAKPFAIANDATELLNMLKCL